MPKTNKTQIKFGQIWNSKLDRNHQILVQSVTDTAVRYWDCNKQSETETSPEQFYHDFKFRRNPTVNRNHSNH